MQTDARTAICEGHGDAALELLKAGCDYKKRDGDDKLAIELAPDAKVYHPATNNLLVFFHPNVENCIDQTIALGPQLYSPEC
jgi:hypothetical protein